MEIIKDYFEILQISPAASDEVIKAAYKSLVKKYHPDNGKKEEFDAEEKMKAINEAYEILTDPDKRKAYLAQRNFRNEVVSKNENSAKETGVTHINSYNEIVKKKSGLNSKSSYSHRTNSFGKIIGSAIAVIIVVILIIIAIKVFPIIWNSLGLSEEIHNEIEDLKYNFHLD